MIFELKSVEKNCNDKPTLDNKCLRLFEIVLITMFLPKLELLRNYLLLFSDQFYCKVFFFILYITDIAIFVVAIETVNSCSLVKQ
jgi:hypothetical protein